MSTKHSGSNADKEAQRQLEQRMLDERMQNIRQKILVLSGKGGVGKSTVAACLAVGLSRAGRSVGLLDVDVHGPSIPQILGLQEQTVAISGNQMQPVKVNANFTVMSIGFLVASHRDAVIWRGPMKYNVIRQFLKDVNWGNLDDLIVDSPPGTGDEPLAVAQLIGRPASAVLVTTPQDLAVSDVRRSVSFCRAVELPILGIVENMGGFVCPSCGHHIDLFKSGGGESLAAETGVLFLGRVPLDPNVVWSGDLGIPLGSGGTRSASTQALERIVETILRKSRDPVAEMHASEMQEET